MPRLVAACILIAIPTTWGAWYDEWQEGACCSIQNISACQTRTMSLKPPPPNVVLASDCIPEDTDSKDNDEVMECAVVDLTSSSWTVCPQDALKIVDINSCPNQSPTPSKLSEKRQAVICAVGVLLAMVCLMPQNMAKIACLYWYGYLWLALYLSMSMDQMTVVPIHANWILNTVTKIMLTQFFLVVCWDLPVKRVLAPHCLAKDEKHHFVWCIGIYTICCLVAVANISYDPLMVAVFGHSMLKVGFLNFGLGIAKKMATVLFWNCWNRDNWGRGRAAAPGIRFFIRQLFYTVFTFTDLAIEWDRQTGQESLKEPMLSEKESPQAA